MLVRGSIQAPDRAGASNRWLAGNNNGIIFRIHSSVVDGLSPETAISRAKKKKQNVKKCKNSTHTKKGNENERKKDTQTDRQKEREGRAARIIGDQFPASIASMIRPMDARRFVSEWRFEME